MPANVPIQAGVFPVSVAFSLGLQAGINKEWCQKAVGVKGEDVLRHNSNSMELSTSPRMSLPIDGVIQFRMAELNRRQPRKQRNHIERSRFWAVDDVVSLGVATF